MKQYKNILDNLEHVNIVDRFAKVLNKKGKKVSIQYVTEAIRIYLFPEYRYDPDLENKVQSILIQQ
jgi:hypothetical protein